MIGWTTLVDANVFFSTRRLESTAWDALTAVSGGKDEKTAVLLMAYDRLRYCKDFSIPASPTVLQLEKLAMAQLETAYYLAVCGSGEDRRKGLQAQGVNQAGVVKEGYNDDYLSKLPLPPIVYELMEEFVDAKPFYIVDIGRNEDKTANESVSDEEDYE